MSETEIMNEIIQLEQKTERILALSGDIEDLLIIGGVIWGDNPEDDYFIDSHGVKTPDAFWKVVIRGGVNDTRAIAWLVPNTAEAKRKALDKYLISIEALERLTNVDIPVPEYVKYLEPENSWVLPIGCDKG